MYLIGALFLKNNIDPSQEPMADSCHGHAVVFALPLFALIEGSQVGVVLPGYGCCHPDRSAEIG